MAEWDTEYINDLPDSAFACIDDGGEKDEDGKTTPRDKRHYPHHDASGKVDLPHLRNARARVQQEGTTSCGYEHLFSQHSLPSDEASMPPPRDNLVRAQLGGFELRSVDDAPMPTLAGHFAIFDEWAEIDSLWEGRFLERIAPGSFTKTIQENRARMRVTFQHGQDPQFGDKPLGPIEELEEDDIGARYAVPLLDTSYNRDLLPGLKAGLYGSSFRFRVWKEELVHKPKVSSHNPEALPERTIREAQVHEFGPVTYPAYAGTSAGVRSLTDEYQLVSFRSHPERLQVLLAGNHIALPPGGAGQDHSDEGSRKAVYPPITLEEFLEKIHA